MWRSRLSSTSTHTVLILLNSLEGIGNVTETAEFNFQADPQAAHTVLILLNSLEGMVMWRSRLSSTSTHTVLLLLNSLEGIGTVMWGSRLSSPSTHIVLILLNSLEGIGNVTESAEFNFHADPEAAHTVLRLVRWGLNFLIN